MGSKDRGTDNNQSKVVFIKRFGIAPKAAPPPSQLLGLVGQAQQGSTSRFDLFEEPGPDGVSQLVLHAKRRLGELHLFEVPLKDLAPLPPLENPGEPLPPRPQALHEDPQVRNGEPVAPVDRHPPGDQAALDEALDPIAVQTDVPAPRPEEAAKLLLELAVVHVAVGHPLNEAVHEPVQEVLPLLSLSLLAGVHQRGVVGPKHDAVVHPVGSQPDDLDLLVPVELLELPVHRRSVAHDAVDVRRHDKWAHRQGRGKPVPQQHDRSQRIARDLARQEVQVRPCPPLPSARAR
mmetsp:Transcript_538/g.1535  ORF Transcript_538/g.1535 Transcript_538/m.1535 type:complete len:291 (+) Transcript_538:2090-2962(+)